MCNSSTIDGLKYGLLRSPEPAERIGVHDAVARRTSGEAQVCCDGQPLLEVRGDAAGNPFGLGCLAEFSSRNGYDPSDWACSGFDHAEDGRWFDDASASSGQSCKIRWAHDARLTSLAPAMATVLVQASVAGARTELPRVFRGVIHLFLSKLGRTLVRLRAWTRRVNELGARVAAVILLPPSFPLGRVAEVDLEPEHRAARTAMAAEAYYARLSTHCRWMSRHASGTPLPDRLDGLHDTVKTALDGLQAGSIGLDEFATAVAFAHRDVLDDFKKEGRNQRRAAHRRHDIAREVGQDEEDPAGFAQSADTQILAQETEDERDAQRARLPDELAFLGGAPQAWKRETAAYLEGPCLTLGHWARPGELAVHRGVDPATGSRNLNDVFRALRRRLE